MNGNDDLKILQNELTQLRDELHPLCDPSRTERPPALLDLSDELCKTLIQYGDPTDEKHGVDPGTIQFIDQTFRQSIEGINERMRARLDLLRRAKKFGEEAVLKSPFGTVEAIFPIKANGQTVHCLWTGPIKKNAFTDKDIETVARLTGLDVAEISATTAGVQPRSEEAIDEVLEFYRALATSLSAAVEGAGAGSGSPANQLVDTAMHERSFGVLANGFGHHFNGLLSIILGYSSYVLNNETLSPETTEVMGKIAEAAQRGRRLTDELLSFSGQNNEQISLCKMHEVFSSVISLLETQGTQRVRFVRKMRAENDGIMAMPHEIHQIVFNMLSCAIDTLQESGGEISVRTINFKQPEDDGQERDYIRIDVSDSGALATYSGTEPLFDAIVVQEIQEEHISLSNLHETVQSLEGSLSVVTDATGVTHIEILLPVADENAASVAPKPTSTASQKTNRLAASNIWLVDDDPTFLDMCAQVLRHDGHEVEEFTDGIEMQNAFRQKEREPDLMVFDFSMPEYNGLELREWLVEEGAGLPVVLVSGLSSSTPEIQQALGMRKTYFLQKPFSSAELADIASVAMGETLLGE